MTNSPEQLTSPSQIRHLIGEVISCDEASFAAKSEELIKTRVKELESHAVKKDISAMSDTHAGFIHPESMVRPVSIAEGYLVNDPEIFTVFLKTMRELSASDSFNTSEDPELNYSHLLFTTVQNSVHEYFGNVHPSPEGMAEREKLVMRAMSVDEDESSEELGISAFKKIGVCAERASVANNLLWFAGKEPMMVFGSRGYDGDKSDGHAFLLLTNSKGEKVIYDPANPILVFNEEDKLVQAAPAIFKGGEEVAEGGETKISKPTYKVKNGQPVESKRSEVVFKGNFLDKPYSPSTA